MMTIIARNAGEDHATVPFWQRCDNTGVGLTVEIFENGFIIIQYCLHKNSVEMYDHRLHNYIGDPLGHELSYIFKSN